MKNAALLILIIIINVVNIKPQSNDKFLNAMKKNITLLDSAGSIKDYQDASNNFERISEVEKDKWLPFYYCAFSNIMISTMENNNDKKDIYLDKADLFINKADSLCKNNSEIITLKAFSAEMRISANPMGRWQRYSGIFSQMIDEAIKADTTNPRPEFLQGQMVLYTPEQFGGGAENAKPILQTSLDKYNKFKPESDIHPNWGKGMVESILKGLK